MPARLLISALTLLILAAWVSPAAAQEAPAGEDARRVLMVVTNVATMGDVDKPTGYWMSEVSHAWMEFVDAEFEVDFASPQGGLAPIDPRSFDLDDADNRRMWETLEAVEALATTHDIDDVDASRYEAVYFAGGHGTMWDFPLSPGVLRVTREVWEDGGVVAAVCHGPAALVHVRLSDGSYLVDGKRVAGFTNSEEERVGLTDAVPFLLEDKLRSRGAEVVLAEDYQENVVTDGRLLTGQNPASATGVAEALVRAVKGGEG